MGDIKSKKVTAPANLIPLELHKFHKGGDERPFLADVDIICNGGFIPVHSCVLRAGSRLFNDFFSEVVGTVPGSFANNNFYSADGYLYCDYNIICVLSGEVKRIL